MVRYLIILFILISCKPTSTKVVKTSIDQYLTPVSVIITDNGSVGEIEYGSEPKDVIVQIKNNSETALQDLLLNIPTDQNIIRFKSGSNGSRNSPGFGGTCSNILNVNQVCTYVLSIATSKRGYFSTNLNLSYKNLVKEQSNVFNINGLVGVDAALIFSNNQIAYDYSILEQTDPAEKFSTLEIYNNGELSARNISSVVTNTSGNGSAYRLVSNSCGTVIKGGTKCNITIGYKALNNNSSDASQTYKGNINFSYLKNPSNLTSQLNGTFKFFATKIQASFNNSDSTLTPIVFNSTSGPNYTTVGTKQTKSFSVINTGYKAGIIDKILISGLSVGNVECIKGSSSLLNCSASSTPTTLTNFPFIIEDLNNCLGRSVSNASGSCNFNLTFWPSSNISSGATLNNLTIKTVSRDFWKNDTTSQTTNSIVDISPITFSGAGDLILSTVEVTPPGLGKYNTYTWPGTSPSIGTIKTLGSSNPNLSSTFYNIVLTYKNIGESPVIVNSITDGASTPHTIPLSGGGIDFGYYSSVISTCSNKIMPNSQCTISYRLTPIGAPSTSDLDLFDYYDPMGIAKSYKAFNLNYNNGVLFLDNNSNAPSKLLQSKIEANPIGMGFIVIESGTIAYTGSTGDSYIKSFSVRNVGTSNAKLTSANNQTYNPLNSSDPNYSDWPFQFIDGGNADECGIYGLSAADKILSPNQTCKITVRIKVPDNWRSSGDSFYGTQLSEITRSFENQNELNPTTRSIVNMGLNYLQNSTDASSGTTTNSISLYATFISAANIIPIKPFPLQSAVLYRPSITYNSLNAPYPQNITLGSKIVPETFFDTNAFPYRYISTVKTPAESCPSSKSSTTYQACWDNFYRSHLSIDHLKNLGIPKNSNEYILHAGTFPVGQIINFKYSLVNIGSIYAGQLNFVPDTNTDPITFSINPGTTSLSTGSSLVVNVRFSPTNAGVFSKCGTLSYSSIYNGYTLNRTNRVCIYAEAVNTGLATPTDNLISISSSDNGTTFTNITSPLNSIDNSKMSNYYIITGSAVTSLTKKFKFTNNSGLNLNKFSYYILSPGGISTASNIPASSASPSGALPSPYLSMKDASNGLVSSSPCSENMNLSPGSSCEISITYAPTMSDVKKIYYVGVIFEIASNQYISYTGAFSTEAAPATKLQAVNISFPEPITPSAIGVYDLNRTYYSNSYPISINPDPSNPYSSPMKIVSNELSPVYSVRISNPSTKLKASFLPQWNIAHPATPFPSTEYIDIFSNNNLLVEASRPCFFGDDEGSGLTTSQMGFYSTSSNKCYLKITFKGYRSFQLNGTNCTKTQMGGIISSDCNPYVFNLAYSSTDGNTSVDSTMTMHMQGYMQPNGSSSSHSYLHVLSADSSGMVKISAPTLTENAADKGNILANIICYDKDYTKFYGANIYKLVDDYLYSSGSLSNIGSSAGIENCISYSPGDDIISIPGLLKRNLYFFKILSLRSMTDSVGTVNYISNTNSQILTVPIPDETQFYDPDKLILVDKNYNGIGNRDQAIAYCSQNYGTLYKNSLAVKVKKSLITSSVFSSILNTTNSNGSSYSGFDIGLVSHWLGDDAYDISSSISLFDGTISGGFTNVGPMTKVGSDSIKRAIFSKSCNDKPECNLLYKIVGGDPSDGLFQNGVFYSTSDGATAVIRCFNFVPCPTDTRYLINSLNCVQP